jgi:hypothetical protein
MSMPWKHVSLAACLGQLTLSLILWSAGGCGTRGSTGASISGRQSPERWDTWQHRSSPLKKVEPGAVGHMVAPELTSQEVKAQSRGIRGSAGCHLSMEARSKAAGHVVASEPTSAGRCVPKLQLTWQCVDGCPAPCLDLELVCGGTRSSGYRHSL